MKTPFHFLLFIVFASALVAAELPLANPGFEEGLKDWVVGVSDPGSSVLPAAAYTGRQGLRVADQDEAVGSDVESALIPATAGTSYTVHFWSKLVRGDGMAVYLRFFDEQRKPLTGAKSKNEIFLAIPRSDREWTRFSLSGKAPVGTVFVSIWLHSFSKNKVLAYLDDFTLSVAD